MKSNKGITLLSLIIYIISLTLVISILSIVSKFFYSNTQNIMDKGKYISEFNKFNMYFIEDVKNNKQTYSVTDNEIIFADGTVYTFNGQEDNGIYRNKVKICKNISYCSFSKNEIQVDGIQKNIIKVNIVIEGSKTFSAQNEYVLKYW